MKNDKKQPELDFEKLEKDLGRLSDTWKQATRDIVSGGSPYDKKAGGYYVGMGKLQENLRRLDEQLAGDVSLASQLSDSFRAWLRMKSFYYVMTLKLSEK